MSICPKCSHRVKRKNRKKIKGVWVHKKCPPREAQNDHE